MGGAGVDGTLTARSPIRILWAHAGEAPGRERMPAHERGRTGVVLPAPSFPMRTFGYETSA